MNIYVFFLWIGLFIDSIIGLHLKPPFLRGLDDGLSDFSTLGSTVILENIIRLTPPEKSKEGFIWQNTPNLLKDWEAFFTLNITGHRRGGEGVAFLYSQKKYDHGATIIIPADFIGLAVVFDSTALGRANSQSIRVVTGGNSTKVVGGCSVDFRRLVTVGVTYQNNSVLVALSVRPERNLRNIYRKDKNVELFECVGISDVDLPQNLFFGFSAQTSTAFFDSHEIHSFSVSPPVIEKGKDSIPTPQQNTVVPPSSTPPSSISTPPPSQTPPQPASPPPSPSKSDTPPTSSEQESASADYDIKLENIKMLVESLFDSFNSFSEQSLKARTDIQEQVKSFQTQIITKTELHLALDELKVSVSHHNKEIEDFILKQKSEVEKLSKKFDTLSKVYDEKLKKLEEAKLSIDAALRKAQVDDNSAKEKILDNLMQSAKELKHTSSWGWSIGILVIQIITSLGIVYYWKKKDAKAKKMF